MIDGKVHGLLPARAEPGGRLGARQAAAARHGQPRLAGRPRPASMIESATFWKDAPGDRDRRDRRRRSPAPRCSSSRPPRTWRRRARSPRPSGCCSGATRRSSRRATAAPSCGSSTTSGRMLRERLAGSTDRAGPAAAGPHLGLPDARRDATSPSAEAVLREINGYEVATGRPLSTLHRDEGRRLHRRRLLDLLRRLRRRGQPGRPAQARHGSRTRCAPEWGWAWPAEPAHPLQPRLGRPATASRGASARSYVWWDAEQGEWTGHDVPGLRGDQAAVLPCRRRARPGAGGARAATTRSSCRPTARAGCSRRTGWSTGRCRRTTSRPSRRSATRSTASRPTRPARCTAARTTRRTRAPPEAHSEVFPFVFTTYRLTEHHTAGGMSRQLPYLAELQPELFVEVSPELAARARAGAPRLGARRHRPRGDRGAGAGHRPAARRCGSRAGWSTRSGCPTTGARAAWSTGDSANDLFGIVARPERAHPGEQGRHLRHPAGPPAARARRCWSSSRTTGGGPGSSRPDTAYAPIGHDPAADAEAAHDRRRTADEPARTASFGPLPTRPATPATPTHPPRVGFFTDTSVCIGCKACEVACKEWNASPTTAFDLLGHVATTTPARSGANSWRHVAFIEQPRDRPSRRPVRPAAMPGVARSRPARQRADRGAAESTGRRATATSAG